MSYYGPWWSSSILSESLAWNRYLYFYTSLIYRYHLDGRSAGFTVRCLKNTLPQVNTTSVTNVTPSTALVTGEVISEGDQNIVRGFCYSTTPNPTISNDTTMNGTGAGVYSDTLLNLTPSTTYYVRAYATNSVGTSYGTILDFYYSLPLPQPCPGTPTVTDVDGNIYNTVQIGTQCWTQSNLKVSKYRNGDSIPTGLVNSAWENTTSGAYAIYNNDPTNESFYGKLYNWYTVIDSRSLCPTGWHVPSDAEWKKLVLYLDANADTNCLSCSRSNYAGGFMKSTGNEWGQPNVGAVNISGFTALPSGYYDSLSFSSNSGIFGYWWSNDISSNQLASMIQIGMYSSNFFNFLFTKNWGFSVRCLKNTLPQVNTTSVTNVTPSTALVTGEVISEGGDQNTTRGICYSTSPNPTISNITTMNGTGIGVYSVTLQNLTPSTTYYVRAYATNSVGTSYGSELSFTTDSLPGVRCPGTPTVTDIDGNVYNTVQVVNQCWTQSNLKTSRYRNGDAIPTGLSDAQWGSTSSGAYAIYNNDPVNDNLYGKLYNWYAVNDSRGLCPTGWHVPSDGEWTTLANHLGGSSVAGGSLKSTATQPAPGGWNAPNTGATNSSGFTAFPGGARELEGTFVSMGFHGAWWNSTDAGGGSAWTRGTYYLHTELYRYGAGITRYRDGFSVRCLKNALPQVNTTSVTNVTPSTVLVTGEVNSDGGDQNTIRGFCYSTTPSPTISNDTTMNGTGLGVYSGTLQNLTPLTTYYVRAYATNSLGTSYGNEVSFTTGSVAPSFTCGTSTVSDVDNNTYNTVQIGTQCWTQSNLKVSKYGNGDNIPTGLVNSAWQNTTSGAYAIYNNDPVNDGLYGKLYNHYAVTDSRGLCPTGWHVPSDGEWTTLENHLGGSSVAGGSLKSTAMQPTPGGWYPPYTGATNSSGFTALPGGLRGSDGDFDYMTNNGYWWSSSVMAGSRARGRKLHDDYSYVSGTSYYRTVGFSVRCLKD
jgi:uncharacterized protein (TIGR02145 family)